MYKSQTKSQKGFSLYCAVYETELCLSLEDTCYFQQHSQETNEYRYVRNIEAKL